MRRTQSLTWIGALLVLSLAGCGGAVNSNTTSSPPPSIRVGSVSPASLDFGNIVVGTTAPADSVAYQNVGSSPLAITAISASGDYAQSNDCGTSLAAGAACNISVSFTPSALGARNGNLQIAADSPQKVPLSGVGVNMHDVLLSWDPSASPVIGYFVYRSRQSGGPYIRQNSSPEPLTTFQGSAPGGQNWYFIVTAVDANLVESLPSNEAAAVVPP